MNRVERFDAVLGEFPEPPAQRLALGRGFGPEQRELGPRVRLDALDEGQGRLPRILQGREHPHVPVLVDQPGRPVDRDLVD